MTWQTELNSWLSPTAMPTAPTPIVGQKAPDTPKLNDLIPARDGKPTILTFLRHCGCPFAERTFLTTRDMAAQHPNITFIAVSHSDQAATDRWLAALPQPAQPTPTPANLHVMVDAEREAYAAWGLGVSSLWHVLGSIPATFRLKAQGISVRDTESGSRWQTAGSFGVDVEGTVRWVRVDSRADDGGDLEEGVGAVLGGGGE